MSTSLIAALTHPYPLIRGGGIFLICVGLGFFLGLFFPRRWIPLAAGGFIAGFTCSGLSALLPSLGSPSFLNIAALVVAVLFEVAAIVYLVRKFGDSDERRLTLSIMLVVGLHFVIMGWAHGPLIAALGVLTAINAAVGLFALPNAPIKAFYLPDSVLKIAFGVWMLVFYPAYAF
ncbi:hypothetical protein Aph01nite_70650 [Acrocarpospora phusangensis]|uniref:Uncharacterized protein n=1 Tax=Acrocarpospora phusangensis TaxID=1070424 RepID=A0A919QJU9_9ACTN|nr:DUF6609 family protein [Acrocarpospora phusangensis]GIH28755.1 hypothetical protein Aph01nite_70650 [Acrocarpospora phusangensis]